jgi:hypothetical protein
MIVRVLGISPKTGEIQERGQIRRIRRRAGLRGKEPCKSEIAGLEDVKISGEDGIP